MKKYYTIVQDFETEDADFDEWLRNNGITYRISADFETSLATHGYKRRDKNDRLMIVYVVLIDEYELSVIQLAIKGLLIIKNAPHVERINKIRNLFRWFLK